MTSRVTPTVYYRGLKVMRGLFIPILEISALGRKKPRVNIIWI